MNFHAPVVPNEVCHFQTHPPDPSTCFRSFSEHTFRQTVPRTVASSINARKDNLPFSIIAVFPNFLCALQRLLSPQTIFYLNLIWSFPLLSPLVYEPVLRCGEHAGNSWQSGPKKIPSYPSDWLVDGKIYLAIITSPSKIISINQVFPSVPTNEKPLSPLEGILWRVHNVIKMPIFLCSVECRIPTPDGTSMIMMYKIFTSLLYEDQGTRRGGTFRDTYFHKFVFPEVAKGAKKNIKNHELLTDEDVKSSLCGSNWTTRGCFQRGVKIAQTNTLICIQNPEIWI